MWTNRVPASIVGSRIDSEYYAPEVFDHLSMLSRIGATPLSQFVVDIRSEPPIHTDDYSEDGIHIVSPANFSDFVIDFSNTKKLASRHKNRFREFALIPGRLLYALVGNVGHACVVPTDVPEAISYRRTANLLLNGVDTHFVCAVLNTQTGSVQFNRLATGVIQSQVRLEDSAGILLPTVGTQAQRYIGDKVRQAERLRELARTLVEGVQAAHRAHIPVFQPSRPRWATFRIAPKRVADVLVPHFYPPAVDEYLEGRSHESLRALCLSVYSGQTYQASEMGGGVDQATSRSCSGRFLKHPCNVVQAPGRSDLDLRPHDLLFSNAAHDKTYIGSDVTYFHGGSRTIPSAKVMVLRANRTRVPASFLFVYLRTEVGYVQIQSAIRGISAGIRADDIAQIQIPIPQLPADEHQSWLAQDLRMVEAGAAEEFAAALTRAATLLVEQLIEGKISEADLVAAQRALEAGDRNADHTLLQSLRRGDAPDAPPLFDDVDALYALLDQDDTAGGQD